MSVSAQLARPPASAGLWTLGWEVASLGPAQVPEELSTSSLIQKSQGEMAPRTTVRVRALMGGKSPSRRALRTSPSSPGAEAKAHSASRRPGHRSHCVLGSREQRWGGEAEADSENFSRVTSPFG